MNAHNKTQITDARINSALKKNSSCDSPILNIAHNSSDASSSATKILKDSHKESFNISTLFFTVYSPKITINTHTYKDEHTHDFTHRFALIFQSTFVLAHLRSKRSFQGL